MFYYKNWHRFCRWLADSGYRTCTAQQSLERDEPFVVLKHDVETNVPRALQLAQIEQKYGICGSYYVQAYLLDDPKNVDMLRQMQAMGHEISYHYDVLDANNGDFDAAERDFDRWLERFRQYGFDFVTICQHGNPVKDRKGYTSNRDFFRNPGIKARHSGLVDMVVDYSRHIRAPYAYVSDAGYMWKHITEPETNDLRPGSTDVTIGGFGSLKNFVTTAGCAVIISTHPHRWERTMLRSKAKRLLFRTIRGGYSVIKRIPLASRLMNRFYFLAKKI